MSSTKNAGTSTDFRTIPPPGSPVDFPSRFSGIARLDGIAGPGELNELRVLEEFLDRHVVQNRICDVQCMLLWNEWIRAFRRQESGFPDLVREREFRTIITGIFGVGITTDGERGAIYPGLRFVP